MRVLIIGDAGSIFIKEYIEYVLLKQKCEVVLVKEAFVCDNYLDFYAENGVRLEPLCFSGNSLVFKIPKIRSWLGVKIWCNYIRKKYGHFDMIHIHGLNNSRGNMGAYLNSCADNMAITVWGDELFRKNDTVLKYYRRYYAMADFITVSTRAMYKRFMEVYGDMNPPQVTINKFAIGLFDIIDRIRSSYTREQICSEFGITSPEKRIVLIGHNGREAQRHFELTRMLACVDKKLLDHITLVYTMTYGVASRKYLDDLEEEAKRLNCDYVILTEFMDEQTTAKLRCISDILIHAQLTDGFSASIQESLYSGTVIINGSWLPYDDFPDYHNSVVEYDMIEELPAVIENVLTNYDEYVRRFSGNRESAMKLLSIEQTTNAWVNSLKIKS